jgi:hypothetical protein
MELQIPSSSLTTDHISGLFRADIMNPRKKIVWVFLGILGIIMVGGELVMLFDPTILRGVEPRMVFIYCVCLLLGILLIYTAYRKIRTKTGAKFTGVRMDNSVLQKGELTTDLSRINSNNKKDLDGTILEGTWISAGELSPRDIILIIVLKEQSRTTALYGKETTFSFDSLHWVVNNNSVCSVYSDSNNLVLINKGRMQELGALSSYYGKYKEILPYLQSIQNLFSTFKVSVDCRLSFVAQTVRGSTAFLFGAVGGSVKAIIDASRRKDLRDKFVTRTGFEPEFTDSLFQFTHSNNWRLFVENEEIQ